MTPAVWAARRAIEVAKQCGAYDLANAERLEQALLDAYPVQLGFAFPKAETPE